MRKKHDRCYRMLEQQVAAGTCRDIISALNELTSYYLRKRQFVRAEQTSTDMIDIATGRRRCARDPRIMPDTRAPDYKSSNRWYLLLHIINEGLFGK